MRAEVAILLAAAGVLLIIGLFGQIMTEVQTVVPDVPGGPTTEIVRPYLSAGMTSVVLGIVVLVIAGIAAVATRNS